MIQYRIELVFASFIYLFNVFGMENINFWLIEVNNRGYWLETLGDGLHVRDSKKPFFDFVLFDLIRAIGYVNLGRDLYSKFD